MAYTTDRQPQGNIYYWPNKIREAMIAELIAVNDYEFAIANTDIDDLRHLFEHIMEDEKRHYGMFLRLLRQFDRCEAEKYEEVQDHVKFGSKPKHAKASCLKDDEHEYCELRFIRDNIKGELEAIILYEQHIAEIKDETAQRVFAEIILDEKEHVEELTLALERYDKDPY